MIGEWQFAWWWAFAALPLPLLVRLLVPPAPSSSGPVLLPPAEADFAALNTSQSGRSTRWRLLAAWGIWVCLVGAAARPQHLGEPVSLPLTGRDLLLAVDLSGSMEERDFQVQGSWVDRLTATKVVATEFVDRRIGDRLGLILFGRNAYLQTPLTYDRETVKVLLSEAAIGLAGKETAIGDAIGLSLKTLTEAGVEDGRRVLILLTDGANTAGEVEPLKAAQLAAQRGMIIYTIGIGADELLARSLIFGNRRMNPSRDLDENTLRSIAATTGGTYFRARDTAELERIYAQLDELEPAAEEASGFRPVTEYFIWPLATGLALASFWMLLSIWPKGKRRSTVGDLVDA